MNVIVRHFIFVAGIFVLVWSLPASGADLYVSTSGNDTNPGTKQRPLATVQKALDILHTTGRGTIRIGAGCYRLEHGLRFGPGSGGTPQRPIVIRGAGSGKTRLCGARVVRKLRPITSAEARPLIANEAKKHVLVADLARQGFASLDPLPLQFRAHGCAEVIFDDVPLPAARWPNEGFMEFTDVIDSGASKVTHWVQRNVYRPGTFRFPGNRAKRWNFQRGVWLHGFWCYDWCDEVIKAASYDRKTGALRLAAKHAYGIGSPWKRNSKRRFYAVHVFAELDRPGEYYLDRKKNQLYLWPPGPVGNESVQLTICREPIIRITGVSNLVLRDLTVENGRNAGIVMADCKHCRIENCQVRNLGRNGIGISGTDISVVACEVTQTASYGISIRGGERKTLTPGKCSVRGCRIHHIGRLDWMSGRGIIVGGCGNHAANNLIYFGPTGAVSYGGNEHVLELNEVRDVCRYYSDVGVFYTGRDWASRGNVVRWNYIHDNTNNAGSGSSAIYLDDCDSGDTVLGNIVYRGAGRGILLGGGRDNIIKGNIFIDLPIGVHVDARGPRGITLDKPGSWNLLEKCKRVGYDSPLWKKRYPKLATVMEHDPLMPVGNSIRDNILIACTKPYSIAKGIKPEWLGRVNNRELTLQQASVLFTSGSDRMLDLSRLPELWHTVPGFPPIPIDRIGLQGMTR